MKRKTLVGTITSAIFAISLLATNAVAQNTFPGSGNAGIGTSTPTANLEINSGYSFAYSTANTTYDANNYKSLNIINSDAPQLTSPPFGVTYVPGNTNDIISVWKKSYNGAFPNKKLFVLTADGKLRIGEKAATGSYANYKLSVDGDVIAKRLVIQVSNWADFVFAADYNRPTLADVANFVALNKHLPGVPSEADVVANGIEVGEINKILLQKIEELTLYLIDMKKDNEKEISELKMQIQDLQDSKL